jgi:hypothetical protein
MSGKSKMFKNLKQRFCNIARRGKFKSLAAKKAALTFQVNTAF